MAGVLSAKALNGKDVNANSQAILRVTDGQRWICVCSSEAMTMLFGSARNTETREVEGMNVTFVNWMDVGSYYPRDMA
jgi:hypothetical protein